MLLPLLLAATVGAPSVQVVPTHYSGVEPHVVERLEAARDDGIARGKLPVADAEGSAELRIDVSARDRSYTFSVHLVDPTTQRTLATSAGECDVCGTEEAAATLADLVAALGPKIEALLPRDGRIQITSDPSKAQVSIDGRPAGTTPLETPLPAGAHTIHASARGYRPRQLELVIVSGITDRVFIELSRTRRWRAPVSGALFGLGVPVIAAGATLWALHERPYRARCSGVDVDVDGRCRFSYDTLAGGVSAVVGGVTLVATGMVVLLSGSKRRRARPTGDGVAIAF